MTHIMLNVLDGSQSLHAAKPRAYAEALVAAITAGPETIAELHAAVGRFVLPATVPDVFADWQPGTCDEPAEAGLYIIDLAARLVVVADGDTWPQPRGGVFWCDANGQTDQSVPYTIPKDWLFLDRTDGWQARADERRRQRAQQPPLDARAVLYGNVCNFLAHDCLTWSAADAPPLPALPGEDRDDFHNDNPATKAVRNIHARWLLTPRDDLRGRAPRDLLLDGHGSISWDLQDRSEQWSTLGHCPPGLSPESAAYHFAPFGTHEIVLYYDLVRDLVHECWERCRTDRPADLAAEVRRLERLRDDWLDSPDEEDRHGWTRRYIIDRERARLPMAIPAGQAIIDHDCPLCQMLADGHHGPVFWNLDGCNMDRDFAFSFHPTLADYEKEQRDYEEFNRKFNEQQAERQRLGVDFSSQQAPGSPWQRTFVADDAELPLGMRLFGIGTRLAELIVDLKEPVKDRPLIDRLNRDFGNLREVLQSADAATAASLLEPVLDRFGETLEDTAATRADLQDKCDDLRQSLRRFLEPRKAVEEVWDDGEDLPF